MSAQNNREVEVRGATVDKAIEIGLTRLGVSRQDVIVDVLDEGSRGLLGIGARDAVVRLVSMKADAPAKPPVSVQKEAPVKAEPVVKAEPAPKAEVPVKVASPQPVAKPEPVATASVVDGDDGDENEAPEPLTAEAEEALLAEEKEAALVCLQTLLEQMHIQATMTVTVSEADDMTGRRVNVLQIEGNDLGVLIGPRGESLNSLQYISRLIVGHQLHRRADFVVDVESYRERRQQALARLAIRMAEKAASRKRPVSLEPMPAYERRIIHMTLRDDKDVYTQSVGEGSRRRVRIMPK